MITIYEAQDGTTFDSPTRCEQYEAQALLGLSLQSALRDFLQDYVSRDGLLQLEDLTCAIRERPAEFQAVTSRMLELVALSTPPPSPEPAPQQVAPPAPTPPPPPAFTPEAPPTLTPTMPWARDIPPQAPDTPPTHPPMTPPHLPPAPPQSPVFPPAPAYPGPTPTWVMTPSDSTAL